LFIGRLAKSKYTGKELENKIRNLIGADANTWRAEFKKGK
jgi:hypothetical protein